MLEPRGDLLCGECLTLLINSAANVPPRGVDCFKCETPVETIAGVVFEPSVDSHRPARSDGDLGRKERGGLGLSQAEERSWPALRIDNARSV